MKVPSAFSGIALLALSSCQVQPYAPPPQKAFVETLEVQIKDFEGRPDAQAVVSGRMSSNVAQLVDHQQSRDGDRLYIDVLEQTPRGATLVPNLTDSAPFQTIIPIDLLGLEPGVYTVSANGIETTLEIPTLRAEATEGEYLAATSTSSTTAPPEVVDEFIAIEDSVYVDPATVPTSIEVR